MQRAKRSRKTNRRGWAGLLLAAAGLLGACGEGGVLLPPDPPTRVGTIFQVDTDLEFEQNKDILLKILVKADPEEECGVLYWILTSTGLAIRRSDGSVKKASVDDLRVGKAVRVWQGSVTTLFSCPGLNSAAFVEIEE